MNVAVMDHGRPKSRPLRILVVEDNDDSRELMAELLRLTGDHEIALAEGGEQGLHHLRGAVYDMVITDIGLPDVSGLEMLDQAWSEGLLGETSIVVCSAHEELQTQACQRGARFLPKPLDADTLCDAVSDFTLNTVSKPNRARK